MSADNGIYILELKDQARVIHAQAIDNLWWSNITRQIEDDFVPTRLVDYFSASEPLSIDDARKKAFEMEPDYEILEYGISTFKLDKTWNDIVEEAKAIAQDEIDAIRSDPDFERYKEHYQYDLEFLEDLLTA